MDYLLKELKLKSDLLKNSNITSIFIGGGTPSLIEPYEYEKLVEYIFSNFNIDENLEFTIESNPNSLSYSRAKGYRELGINRLSIGVQSFDEFLLGKIGRVHNREDIFKCVDAARSAGFKNINLDLLLSLPYQNLSHIENSLREVEKLSPEHISYYSLIIEEGTPMWNRYRNSPELFPSEEEDRKYYHYILNGLKTMGYRQYEISNFAKEGYTCSHNLNYWKIGEYVGIGMGAHSNIDNTRYYNVDSFTKYYSLLDSGNFPTDFCEELTSLDRINEFLSMGLRLIEGIDFNEFYNRFKIELEVEYSREIEKNISLGLLQKDSKGIRLTEKGLDFSNLVEVDFFRV